jgi:hypothetical protein
MTGMTLLEFFLPHISNITSLQNSHAGSAAAAVFDKVTAYHAKSVNFGSRNSGYPLTK